MASSIYAVETASKSFVKPQTGNAREIELHNAIKLAEESYERAKATPDSKDLSERLMILGQLYRAASQYVKALQCFSEALSIFDRNGEKKEQACVLEELAMVYEQLGDFRIAYYYYKKYNILKKEIVIKELYEWLKKFELCSDENKEKIEVAKKVIINLMFQLEQKRDIIDKLERELALY